MALFYVIFSQFNVNFIKGIDNLIFLIFTFNGLRDTLYFYIVKSAVLINVIPLIDRLDFKAYRHGSIMMKTSLNSE